MHLGIAVVYKVRPENVELLKLHLDQIKKHTKVPYTLYAGMETRFPFKSMLEKEPNVKLVHLPDQIPDGERQHPFYLKIIIDRVVSDPVSHISILHVDSFPIRSDWIESIIKRLSENCILATVSEDNFMTAYTACLVVKKEFYLKHQPELLISAQDRQTELYERFRAAHPHHPFETGAGFVFKAFCENLSWVQLERSNKAENHKRYGSIYNDILFHLQAAFRQHISEKNADHSGTINRMSAGFILFVKRFVKNRFPARLWKGLKSAGYPVDRFLQTRSYAFVRSKLLADPEGYISFLRYGKKSGDVH